MTTEYKPLTKAEIEAIEAEMTEHKKVMDAYDTLISTGCAVGRYEAMRTGNLIFMSTGAVRVYHEHANEYERLSGILAKDRWNIESWPEIAKMLGLDA